MLVRLHHYPEHFRGLQVFLVNQPRTDVEELRERVLNDLIKVRPVISRLEPVYTADGKETLQPREYRVGIIRA